MGDEIKDDDGRSVRLSHYMPTIFPPGQKESKSSKPKILLEEEVIQQLKQIHKKQDVSGELQEIKEHKNSKIMYFPKIDDNTYKVLLKKKYDFKLPYKSYKHSGPYYLTCEDEKKSIGLNIDDDGFAVPRCYGITSARSKNYTITNWKKYFGIDITTKQKVIEEQKVQLPIFKKGMKLIHSQKYIMPNGEIKRWDGKKNKWAAKRGRVKTISEDTKEFNVCDYVYALSELKKWTAPYTSDSILMCLNKVLKTNISYKELWTEPIKAFALCKQELYMVNTQNEFEQKIQKNNNFLNPKYYIRILEYIFKIKIYIITNRKKGDKLINDIFIPNYTQSYYTFKNNNNVVILYENWNDFYKYVIDNNGYKVYYPTYSILFNKLEGGYNYF